MSRPRRCSPRWRKDCPMKIRKASGVLGFDTTRYVSTELGRKFHADGYRFCVRYVQRTVGIDEAPGGSLTSDEPAQILAAGLALMPVQFAKKDLDLNKQRGTEMGSAMGLNCQRLGFPPGVTCWYDLEAVFSGENQRDIIEHLNEWCSVVQGVFGFTAGLYVGPNSRVGATGVDLYRDLAFQHYWSSAARVPSVDVRGYQMVQGRRQQRHGIAFDPDLIRIDAKGGRPYWLAPEVHDVP